MGIWRLAGAACLLAALGACQVTVAPPPPPVYQPPVYTPPPSVVDYPPLTRGEIRRMRDFCRREAAGRYRVAPGRVDLGRLDFDGRRYRLDGRLTTYDAQVSFVCRFGPRGGFDGMAETGRRPYRPNRPPPQQPGLSMKEMAVFCRDEAARRYRVRPGAVRVDPTRRAGAGFIVTGSVKTGRGRATFICDFGPRGGFRAMKQTN